MPQLIISPRAQSGLQHCQNFLRTKNPEASRRAADAIRRAFKNALLTPEIGRPFDREPSLRELIIPFGDSGYIALYCVDNASDAVVILAFRHQKEAGY